jgi:hypothetical protein
MKFLKRLSELRKENDTATAASECVLATADRDHQIALARLAQATEQADTLSDMNTRNHYSQSLTYAFRGRTA